MAKKVFLLIVLLVSVTGISFSTQLLVKDTVPIKQITKDTTSSALKADTTKVKITENFHILDNIDSLLNLYYVKKSLEKNKSNASKIAFNDTVKTDYPDSVYIERIKSMNSAIDFSYNTVVKDFIDMYAKRKKLVGVMLGLSNYYFPMFEQVLDQMNMPLELKHLAVIESALNPRAVSPAGATGLWQFMYATGKLMGLKINSFVDERRDPVKSTQAAARYLKELYGIYNDWMLAIAAYNCGPGNVNKAIKRSRNKGNYWEIYYQLPRETRGYIPAFIAANYIMTYYQEHGITPENIEVFMTDTIMVTEQLHLEQVSKVLNVDMNVLRDLNPHFKRDVVPAYNDKYPLTIPCEYATKFIELKDSIFAFNDSVYFNPKKLNFKPFDFSGGDISNLAKVFYTVKKGDNLQKIAQWFNVDMYDLKSWNKVKKGVKAGRKLVVYVPKEQAEEFKKLNTMSYQEKQTFAQSYSYKQGALNNQKKANAKESDKVVASKNNDTKQHKQDTDSSVLDTIAIKRTLDSLNMVNTAMDSAAQKQKIEHANNIQESGEEFFYYTVKAGDTIWSIARNFSELTNDIMQLNNMSDQTMISPGQKIKIKKKK